MTTKPTFVNRENTDNRHHNRIGPFDAQKTIDYYLSLHPRNYLIPNSPLYLAAVSQYNKLVRITKVRPAVPTWFCGAINPETGILIATSIDNELRATTGFTLTSLASASTLASSTSGYASDLCLAQSSAPPGSIKYIQCTFSLGNSGDEDIIVSGVDWSESIAQREAQYHIDLINAATVGGVGGVGGGSGGGSGDRGSDVQRIAGQNIRFSVNEDGLGGKGAWYTLNSNVGLQGASITRDAANNVVITAHDFISSVSGVKYYFVGIRVQNSQSGYHPSPTIIPPSKQTGNHRILWILK